VTVFFRGRGDVVLACDSDEIDRSLSIVAENRAKSEPRKFPFEIISEKF